MYTDPLVLSDVGMHAINNSSAGGLLVDATGFKVGDDRTKAKATDLVDIVGKTLFAGSIHSVEVVNKNVARFTFEVSKHAVTVDTKVAEIAVFLRDGSMLGRAVFAEQMTVYANETTRFECLLQTSRCDLTLLNVTIGDHSGLPSTPHVYRLPTPAASSVNAVTIANGLRNPDGSDSPVLAMRYSEGSFQWAFSDHTRVFQGKPAAATPTTLTVTGLQLEEGELAIAHIVTGSGAGQTRRYAYKSGKLVEFDDKPITGLDSNTNIAVWKRIFTPASGSSLGASQYPPAMTNIPKDWVLTRGSGDSPLWAPPKAPAGVGVRLWHAPSKLRVDILNYTGTGDTARFALNALELEGVNYVQPVLGGISQHRSAFDMTGNELEFTENLESGLPVELRMYTREPSNGVRMICMVDEFVGDGQTQKFKLSQPVDSANYVKAYMRGVYQYAPTFTYDDTDQTINLVAPVPSGMNLEVRTFRNVEDEGFSTQIRSHLFTTRGDTFYIDLPFTPQSVEYIEVSLSGAHLHASQYSLVGNKIVMNAAIRRNLEVEVILYDNVMSLGSPTADIKGVVTDAVLTGYSLRLLRHNAPPVNLPIPAIQLSSGPGIRISGNHPYYRIESLAGAQLSDARANFKISEFKVLEDAAEIMFTKRIDLSRDLFLTVTADFSAILGPGFSSLSGTEVAQYVVGFRTSQGTEAKYGQGLQGTGVAGFNALGDTVYANASMTQVYEVIAQNHKTGYLDVVVKMRVMNANIGNYGSKLTLNVNITGNAKVS